jgi:HEAT repeat protein
MGRNRGGHEGGTICAEEQESGLIAKCESWRKRLMTARVTLLLTLLLVGVFSRPLLADTELTKADIPKDLSPELRAIAEDTFSKRLWTRYDAIKRFDAMGEKATQAVPFVVRLLNDSSEGVASMAEKTLKEDIGKHSAIRESPALVASLVRVSRSSNAHARARAASLLGQSRQPGVHSALSELVKDTDDGVRLAAIGALGDLGDRRAASVLRTVLQDASDAIDRHGQQACAAEIAMGKIGAAQTAAGADTRHFARDILYQEVSEWDIHRRFVFSDTREGAIMGLGLLHDPKTVPLLKAVLQSKLGVPFRVRSRAATALADVAGRDAAAVLKKSALDGDDTKLVRGAAAIGFAKVMNGEVDDDRIVEAIVAFPSEVVGEQLEGLLAITKRGKTNAVRRMAAIRYVNLAVAEFVDDIAVVEAIHLRPADSECNKAMLEIAKRGRTKAVRAAAQR